MNQTTFKNEISSKRIKKIIPFDLPDEIFNKIFTFLSISDFLHLRLTNKNIQRVLLSKDSSNNETWKFIIKLKQFQLLMLLNLNYKDLIILKKFIENFMNELYTEKNFLYLKENMIPIYPQFESFLPYVSNWYFEYIPRNQIKKISFSLKDILFKYEERDGIDLRGIGDNNYIFNYCIKNENTLLTDLRFKYVNLKFDLKGFLSKSLKESLKEIKNHLRFEIDIIELLNFILILIGKQGEEIEEMLDENRLIIYDKIYFK